MPNNDPSWHKIFTDRGLPIPPNNRTRKGDWTMTQLSGKPKENEVPTFLNRPRFSAKDLKAISNDQYSIFSEPIGRTLINIANRVIDYKNAEGYPIKQDRIAQAIKYEVSSFAKEFIRTKLKSNDFPGYEIKAQDSDLFEINRANNGKKLFKLVLSDFGETIFIDVSGISSRTFQ